MCRSLHRILRLQIAALQRALEDSKLFIYDERAALLTLRAENDDLKAQEVEDRVRIQQLLALTGANSDAAAPVGGSRRSNSAAVPPQPPRADGHGGPNVVALRRQLEECRILADERAAAYARDRAAARDLADARAASDAATNAQLDTALRATQEKLADAMRGASTSTVDALSSAAIVSFNECPPPPSPSPPYSTRV